MGNMERERILAMWESHDWRAKHEDISVEQVIDFGVAVAAAAAAEEREACLEDCRLQREEALKNRDSSARAAGYVNAGSWDQWAQGIGTAEWHIRARAQAAKEEGK